MAIWLYIIGFLVLLAIAFDLVRRTRAANRDSLEMDFNMQQGLDEEDPLLPPATAARDTRDANFPSGGARKVERQAVDNTLEDTQKIRRTPSISKPLPLDEVEEQKVPMLMEMGERQETLFSNMDIHDDDPLMSGSSPILSRPRVVPRKNTEKAAEEVIVINVMAKQAGGFNGAALLEAVLSNGLRYGEMNIFHYHVSDEDDTPLFSMVNLVNPGVFDLNNMASFKTPGISFFMALPLRDETISAMDTFEKMLGCAKLVARHLDGELRDEKRSVMTGQTIEHCRQRIGEFARKRLSRSGKYNKS